MNRRRRPRRGALRERRGLRSRGSARVATALALAGILVLPSCSVPGDINDTSGPVTLIIVGISQLSDPFGDIISDSFTVEEDSIAVEFAARLKSADDISAPALQDIVLERYEVTFTRTDGGTAVPRGFQRGISAKVQVTPNSIRAEVTTTVEMVILPSTTKTQPPLSHLISPGVEPGTGFVNIQLNAEIRFFGHTVAGEPVAAKADIGINVANFAG